MLKNCKNSNFARVVCVEVQLGIAQPGLYQTGSHSRCSLDAYSITVSFHVFGKELPALLAICSFLAA